jgi:hypothetical protein
MKGDQRVLMFFRGRRNKKASTRATALSIFRIERA